ncbi:D-amino-acid transaminase [Microvirga makkahensis]|uniref:Probable branched-chain-amino-acid aminotransferase n=1 Tax=Microvirga makkahensis TaxID=1128670 RepID=A0A7X3MSG0_9HYPH|nr:D-amino-acid transaminase [Microvirga makkahensis]MXQ12160.1 D-amino-acid transaminase [Microvirga makkahensis]
MPRIAYVNGSYVLESEARISVFDRGFLFGDSIYEVSAVIGGHLIDNDLHLDRLERSLRELDIPMPLPRNEIVVMQRTLIARNELDEGVVYLQVTRGSEDRNFDYSDTLKPSFVAFTQKKTLQDTAAHRDGIKVGLVDDTRWVRRDIKTTMLLSQVQAKRQVKASGCGEAWMVQDGFITEGASSTAFIITQAGKIVTRPNSRVTLPGCTRLAVLQSAASQNLQVEERLFTPDEAYLACEAFLTSASSFVTPVVEIAGHRIGEGRPGPITRRIQRIYLELALSQSAAQ